MNKQVYDRRCWTIISEGPKKKSDYEEFLISLENLVKEELRIVEEELDRVIEEDTAKFCAVCGKRAYHWFPDFKNGKIVRAAFFCGLHRKKVKEIRTKSEDKLLCGIIKQLKRGEEK